MKRNLLVLIRNTEVRCGDSFNKIIFVSVEGFLPLEGYGQGLIFCRLLRGSGFRLYESYRNSERSPGLKPSGSFFIMKSGP